MKAALVLPAYRATYELALLSDHSNLDFTVISAIQPKDNYTTASYEPSFLKATEIPNIPKWMPPKSTARPVFYDGIDEGQLSEFDVFIVVEMFSFLSWQFAKIASKFKKRLVVITWETIPTHPLYSFVPPYSSIWKIVGKLADMLIAMTERSRNHLISLGIDRKKTRVIYPGVDLTKFLQHPEAKQKDEFVNLLFVGLLEKHKGFDLLLSAYLKAKRELDISLRLLIVGQGSLAKELEAIRDQSIVYLGKLPRSEVSSVYQQADIFISPARDSRKFGQLIQEEQFGFTLIEALASGLPIISTKCGAIPEIIGAKNVIVEQDSAEQLVNAIKVLTTDRARRESMSNENRKRANQLFDLKQQSLKFAGLIGEELR